MLYKCLFVFLFLFVSITSYAQLCEGNLGENIFTQGDFGSGQVNIPPNDPGIAPGYTYTTNPPPTDGSYCLTNSITAWNQFWGWANIGDNSTDPNGYMMVVNASYDPGLFYEQLVEDLCENTIYEFSADVRNLHSGANLILPNVSFLIDDVIVYASGNVPENNQWNTYGFTFTTSVGQTEVKLSLANNAPGGDGNDIAIDNITFRACGPEALILPTDIANICEDGNSIFLDATINGDQYGDPQIQWQQSFDGGITWVDIIGANNLIYEFNTLAAGTYYYRYKLASAAENLLNSKCHIISNSKVIEVIPKYTSVVDSLCFGLEFVVGNSTYQNTGIYVDTFTNQLGCDSIVTTDLTFIPDLIQANISTQEPLCTYSSDGSIFLENIENGEAPYVITFDGDTLENETIVNNLESGTYTFVITDNFGCSAEESITLPSPEPFTIEIGEDKSVELGEIITVSTSVSEPAISYVWSPSNIFLCAIDCDEQTWAPSESTWIAVQAVSERNCLTTDSLYIEVRKARKIYIPNTFSPNNDAVNEDFIVFASQPNVLAINLMQIYDRWGNVVFEAKEVQPNDPAISWDGRYKGRTVNSGVYTYLVNVLFLDQEVITYSGTITIIR